MATNKQKSGFSKHYQLLAITPLERHDRRLAFSWLQEGQAVAMDMGKNPSAWPELLPQLASLKGEVGLRLHGIAVDLAIPANVKFLISDEINVLAAYAGRYRLIAQVTSVDEAKAAIALGVDGLIAKGMETGGRVGEQSAFILFQALLSDNEVQKASLPLWVQGGMGLHTTPAVMAMGAFGAVFDSQLVGLSDCQLDRELKASLLKLDGSETVVREQRRVVELRQAKALPKGKANGQTANGHAGNGKPAEEALLPLGQDIGLAPVIARQASTVSAFLRTLKLSITGHHRHAAEVNILGKNNEFARDQSTLYPVVQGPMTRVSDTAEFAAAVAKNGAMPLLALSLLKANQCEKLIQDTIEQVDGKPWGVGVLGFADTKILQPQLDLIKQYKPDRVLIAGGRPSQARQLEALGIPSYLHVPAPGLLELYLKDGARNFVFEGQECGGHIGPRSSFVLWEQQLEILSKFEAPKELRILFAGGIHDDTSAAIVATMAASLAAKGAKVGVLMGSAYLATEEAVVCQAINQTFQDEIFSCQETETLETAPGHVTRCLKSPFTKFFAEEKQRLQEQGLDSHAIWEQLENLIVGRLRIASKGIERVDADLLERDTNYQLEQGMYMIGQVAALNKGLTTMAALHDSVTSKAMAKLSQLQLENTAVEGTTSTNSVEPIAIVGMDCIFPQSNSLDDYWETILGNKNTITEVPKERWNAELYYHPERLKPGKSLSKWGGFIDAQVFDPVTFGIPPKSVAAIEPIQLLSLEVARRALMDAGLWDADHFDRENTSVIFGAESGTDLSSAYTLRNTYQQYLGEMPEALDAVLPTLTEDSFPGVLANVIAGRIANRLDLGGSNFTVDAACASSLTSVDMAVKELRSGSANVVLAGGADFHNSVNDYLMFSSVTALSPTGACKSFDNDADGIALGEGVGVVVLKRLSDAERDGDKIYALINGVSGSSDGRSLGLTAPRKEGQQRALMRAYWQAGVNPADIELVEAHGTGTVVGDKTEMKTLSEIYNLGGAVPAQAALGSVKSQIGHTKCAAGIAGLIKLALSIHHRVLPPTGNISTPNAYYDENYSPFYFNNTAKPWLGEKPMAAISAFGFGGTNFHAVLSAYLQDASTNTIVPRQNHLPSELFVFRAVSQSQAKASVDNVLACLSADKPYSIADISFTLAQSSSEAVQFAVVANSRTALQGLLTKVLAGEADKNIFYSSGDAEELGDIAFLFPGQGSQRVNMLQSLFVHFPELRTSLDANPNLAAKIFPPTLYSAEGRKSQQQALTDTRVAQPALGLTDFAVAKLLAKANVKPDALAGHSYGELVALAQAGCYDEASLLTLSRERGEQILAAVDGDAGAMLAVNAESDRILAIVEGKANIEIANLNSPTQIVISGQSAEIEKAAALFDAEKVAYRAIPVACAFHSQVVAKASETFLMTLAERSIESPKIPVYANMTATAYSDDVTELRKTLAQQIVKPVRFIEQIENMHAAGVRTFIEVGPGRVLTKLTDRILQGKAHRVISVDNESRCAVHGLQRTLAELMCLGVAVDTDFLFAGRRLKIVDLKAPQTAAATAWWVNGHYAKPTRGEQPAHASIPITEPVITQLATASTVNPGLAPTAVPGDDSLVHYLTNMRDLVHAQRDVMLGAMGQSPSVRQTFDSGLPAPMPVATQATAQQNIEHKPEVVSEAKPVQLDVESLLLEVISDRTGYPTELLEPQLDLEADLSIDSIKRVEIVSELAEKLGLNQSADQSSDALMEKLAGEKTIGSLLKLLKEEIVVPASAHNASGGAGDSAASAYAPVVDLSASLLNIIHEKTGYPVEILDNDLDIEADLSIDSIKRIEIYSELLEQHAQQFSHVDRDELMEKLAGETTLGGIIASLESLQNKPAPSPQAILTNSEIRLDKGNDNAEPEDDFEPIQLSRYVLKMNPAPTLTKGKVELAGLRFLMTDDKAGVAEQLQQRLQALGAEVVLQDFASIDLNGLSIDQYDGLIHLWGLSPDAKVEDVKKFYTLVRQALMAGVNYLLAAGALSGDFGLADNDMAEVSFERGSGLSGLLKSIVKEWPGIRGHWVDLDLAESKTQNAQYLEAELLADKPSTEVRYKAGARHTVDVVKVQLDSSAIGDLDLDENSVILMTGGAKGITAELATKLAEKYRCQFELVGRSPMPSLTEEERFDDAVDVMSLRKALIQKHPGTSPADIEKLCRRILSEREMNKTFQTLESLGAKVNYHSLDITDTEKFAQLIDNLYENYGSIAGVVHAAGVIDDRLLVNKTDDSFNRVFDTKVAGAQVLSKHLKNDVQFAVFFSSVAGVFGNRGQVDYASANDVLDKIAHAMQARIDGRVLSVNWGPWSGTGMVSPELERDYAKRGIGLIQPDEGVEALMNELIFGDKSVSQVVLMCGEPETMLVVN